MTRLKIVWLAIILLPESSPVATPFPAVGALEITVCASDLHDMSHWLLSKPCIRFVFFVERWVLSALFLYLGYEYLDTLRLMHTFAQSADLLPQAMVARDGGFIDGIHFEDFARYILLAVSNLVCGVLLLIARQPTRYPTHAQEIVVPLLATCFYMICNQRVSLPLWMTTPFVPAAWTTALAAAGIGFSVVGIVGSLVCILYLGRSLGIVVSVRRIVLAGPYHYVRHPIYLSYAFLFMGLFLTACTVRMTLLVAGAFTMLCWRARLEEKVLGAHSAAYRAWMRRTGFLWPKRRASQTTDSVLEASPVEPMLVPARELVGLAD